MQNLQWSNLNSFLYRMNTILSTSIQRSFVQFQLSQWHLSLIIKSVQLLINGDTNVDCAKKLKGWVKTQWLHTVIDMVIKVGNPVLEHSSSMDVSTLLHGSSEGPVLWSRRRPVVCQLQRELPAMMNGLWKKELQSLKQPQWRSGFEKLELRVVWGRQVYNIRGHIKHICNFTENQYSCFGTLFIEHVSQDPYIEKCMNTCMFSLANMWTTKNTSRVLILVSA